MVGLLDIAPANETVVIREQAVEVFGVSAKGIAYLIRRFPELRALMSGRTVDTDQLLEVGGSAVSAIIAAGCGLPGDEKGEEVASRLAIDDQAELLSVIFKLTMPKGVAPFVEKLSNMGLLLSGPSEAEASTKAPVTKSLKPSKA